MMLPFFNRRKINRRVYERPTLYRLKRSLIDWLKLSGMVLMVSAVLIGSYQFFGRSDFFRLKRIDLLGDLEAGERERLTRLAEIPEGKNLFLINLFEISRNLKRDQEIRDVRLRRNFPDGLIIEVTKHKGVALLELDGGKERYLVSAEGVIFKKARENAVERLPVIRGFEKNRLEQFAEFYRPKIEEAVGALTDLAERAAPRGVVVSSLEYDMTGGMTVVVADRENKKSSTLFFGRGERDSKFSAWGELFDAMKRDDLWYTRLDLHVPGRIFARGE